MLKKRTKKVDKIEDLEREIGNPKSKKLNVYSKISSKTNCI